jgi:hypothetical protein
MKQQLRGSKLWTLDAGSLKIKAKAAQARGLGSIGKGTENSLLTLPFYVWLSNVCNASS